MINLDGYVKTQATFQKRWHEDGDHQFHQCAIYRRCDGAYFYLDNSWPSCDRLVRIADPASIAAIERIDSEVA
jgi:hypothetical protein